MLYYPERVSLKGNDVFYNFRAEGKKKVAQFETDVNLGRIRVKLPNGTALCEYTTDALFADKEALRFTVAQLLTAATFTVEDATIAARNIRRHMKVVVENGRLRKEVIFTLFGKEITRRKAIGKYAFGHFVMDSNLMLMDEERSSMFTRHLVFCMWAAFKDAAETVEAITVPAGVDRNILYMAFRNTYSERCSTLMSAPMSANGLPASVQL